MPTGPPSDRVRVRRHPERAASAPQVLDAIVDEALFCHVAWVAPDGPPRVVPTIHVRVGDHLYIHGSEASRTLRGLRTGIECCIEITIVDGIVLARSTPKHSLNYRSVVVYGVAREVTDPDEKDMAQRALTDHVVPGRSAEVRPPNQEELRETAILALPLDDASAKVRTGDPLDPKEDLDLPVWAGVLPLGLVPGEPVPAANLRPGVEPPDYVTRYLRPER